MPLVYVHGVNTRRGATPADQRLFDDRVELMRQQFARVAFADRVTAPGGLTTFTPYWGDLGVKFARGFASLPKSGVQTLAVQAAVDLAVATTAKLDPEVVQNPSFGTDPLLTVAKSRSLGAALDLLFAAATNAPQAPMMQKTMTDALPEVARFSAAAERYAAANPSPPWLATVQNDQAFVQELFRVVDAQGPATGTPAGEVQTLGIGNDVLTWLRTGAGAVKNAVKDAVVSVRNAVRGAATDAARAAFMELSNYVRPDASAFAGRFVGDVFTYLENRKPIADLVLQSVREADQARRDGDAELYLVGHSFGGIILYDILTKFAPDIKCDLYVTVGSQVGLFAEMGRLAAKADIADAFAAKRAAARPKAAQRWLNIYDLTDFFGFGTDGVFDGVLDYKFETDALPLVSHAAYFDTPRFFARLKERVAEAFEKGTDKLTDTKAK
ncbi:hypothetical protein [Bradyrhizobium sp. HKCCYLR20261]|uniref:hypothetical protein n=1 Tax=Bradyrhizobium sp. HKCCYLR20261 TaxID=3420760 RepID=UPI003EBFB7C4